MASALSYSVEKLYSLYREYPVITTDSRNIPPRSIFFALKGDHFDGNQFAAGALEQGAAIAVVDDPDLAKDNRFMLTENVLQSLQELASFHRKRFAVPVVGITGSNGKTTTKELVHAVLSRKYHTLATQGNLNNHIGVPLTLLSVREDTEIAVIEMGANHPGEIAFLSDLARPTHGLITNIGRAHLEGFGGFDGVVRAKTELYTFLRNHHGKSFLNIDDALLTEHAHGIHAITYGLSRSAGTSGKIIPGEGMGEQGRVNLELHFPHGGRQTVSSSMFGSYNALNMIAAAAVGYHFEVPLHEIAGAISHYTPANSRSQILQTPKNLLLLDAYNANPSSMAAALMDFDRSFNPVKAVILGDMLELGREADVEHLGILKLLETLSIDSVMLVGPVFKRLNFNREWLTFESSPDARNWIEAHPVTNANILLKGSRGIRLEEIVRSL